MNLTKLLGMKIGILLVILNWFGATRGNSEDFGVFVQNKLKRQAGSLLGVKKPLEDSAPTSATPYRTSTQIAKDQIVLAKSLSTQYLTRNAGNNTDMIAFFPLGIPTHLITCVEGAREIIDGGSKYNPAVQRISLANGSVETILRGMDRCDGIRSTPWGTVIVTEETSDGGCYEILNPLTTTEQTVLDRAMGQVTDGNLVAKRTAMMTIAWEGIAVLPSGTVIGGDELRPGTGVGDADGGSIFKFIPISPHAGGDITDLDNSPLVSGSTFAFQASCQSGSQQFGQGCEIGNGTWIPVNASTARSDADANGATGYYRPEDLELDIAFSDPNQPTAIRFCWTNTGNAGASNYAETLCGVEQDPLSSTSILTVNRFVEGDTDFNQFDNIAIQPNTGIWYIIEDNPNGDIFACLRDGADRDIKTDGCIKILSVKDTSAEPTGFIFAPDGKTAFLSIQHSDDTDMPLVDDYATDDILIITGFKDPRN